VLKRLLFLLLAAAAQLRAVELDIPVFAGGYGTAFYVESARKFEAIRPGVKVRLYGDPRIADQVRVRVIDGHYPDAASVANVLWPALIKAGKVVDLAPYLDGPNWEGDARWRDTFFKGALDSWKVGGRVGGIPVSFACWTIFYNKALFRQQGWAVPGTWDEFYALCDRIRAAGIAPLSLPGTSWLYPDAFFRAACHNLLGDGGWRNLDALAPGARLDPRFIRAAEVEQTVTGRYTLRGWEGETHTGAELAFLQGRAAMTVSGSWLVNEMAGKIPDGFELGAMNFPVFPDGAADPTTIQTGCDSFFVFATGDPERERLTVDFLRFLTSRARAEAFVRELDSPVAVRGVPLAAYSPRMRDTAELILGAKGDFSVPQVMMQPPVLRQAMVDDSQLLTEGRITPREFGARLEAAAAEDRARAADPDRIEIRHPVAGTALLAALAGLVFWIVRSAAGRASGFARLRRDKPAGPAGSGDPFPRLRGPAALGFVGPAFVLYAVFALGPGLAALGWAFTRWDGMSPRTWAGLFNFKELLFESDVFWAALRHNAFLMAVPAVVVLPLALLCAALIHRGAWGAGAFRAVLLFPNLLGGIAATLIWLAAYQPHGGLVNAGLARLGGALHIRWLASFDGFPWLAPEHLYAALIPIYIWMACGFNLILFLAAMEGIDPQLYEAADMDGAPAWRQFFAITLPLIREAIVIAAVFLVIGGLNAFEMIWLLTSQDPSTATHTLATLLVTSMFKDFRIGQATALAAILFALVFALSAWVIRVLGEEEADS
jgi:raffinose/stachyose/melibiose transport system permease protein